MIRPAQMKDISEIAQVLADSFHSRIGIWGWFYPLFRLGISEDLKTRLRSTSPYSVCLVAYIKVSQQEHIVGTVEMNLRATFPYRGRQSQYPYISNLAVIKSYRRQGVARKLLCACEQIAIQWGFPELYLDVLENNQAAKQLYYQLGYKLNSITYTWTCWLRKRPKQLSLYKLLITKK